MLENATANANANTARCALVTGATGYIGSKLVHRLVRDGWQVAIVARADSSLAVLDAVLPAISVHRHDGSTSGMVSIVAAVRPDVVFHLASLFLAQHKSDDIAALVGSNLLFSTQLAEGMAANNVRYLVNTGTSWQHYENAPYNPVNLYAATKQAFEDILAYYVEADLLKVTTLALFDTYGPNDPRKKLVTLLRNTAASGEPLYMSPGEQIIDLVHIDDVLDAYLLAAERIESQTQPSACYGVSSGETLNLRQFVALFERVIGKPVPIVWGGRPYREREVMVPWNAPTLDGWTPRIRLEDGLRAVEGT